MPKKSLKVTKKGLFTRSFAYQIRCSIQRYHVDRYIRRLLPVYSQKVFTGTFVGSIRGSIGVTRCLSSVNITKFTWQCHATKICIINLCFLIQSKYCLKAFDDLKYLQINHKGDSEKTD